ncbi:WD40 repeat domain-containing protein [Streptomyces sp. MCA2]|uniref:WD40 repeat domain-containing protein n=1 Tax=Streptomyces sp. MCA2 TaxID=2944805 RepID=UPI00202203DD|nr:WD40 repeat domain-containing protein [Streptomyces sp. MCA2]MCL7493772.1 WD40 repeat domain-containing protein [Streptomyces sp. MCA2]
MSVDVVGYGGLVEAAVVAEDVDVLVVHIVGHGELAEGSSEKLYVLDSDGQRLSRPVGAWIDLIEDHPQRHRPITLFVLDVCYAGEAAVTAWHARMDVDRRRAWVLAATGPGQKAFGYRLSQALVQVLEKYRDLKVRFDPSVRHIPPHTVWRDIERTVNELAAQSGGLPQAILTSLVPGHADLSHLPFFPNPSYDPDRGSSAVASGLPPEIARLADWAADPLHFMRRAGGAEPVHRDWAEGYFSGRTAQLDTLAGWLDDEAAAPGLRVVTGKPGAGKSALLGVLVCAAHPALRRHTRALWAGLGDRAPGENDRLAVVHARRLALDDIVNSLARQLRHIHGWDDSCDASKTSEQAVGNPADYLLGLLPSDERPVTLIVDALDEAVRPQDITTALLLPLARQAHGPGSRLRLLVGTRDDERFRSLLALARDASGCTDLSAIVPEVVCQDVADYVKQLLAADGPYAAGALRPVRDTLARAIADTLTEPGHSNRPAQDTDALHWGEFLTAGLYAHYLLTSPPPGTAEEAAVLGRAVPRSLPALLELDLQRHKDRPLLRPVLTALAFAQGRGMPESVLAHATTAFNATVDSTTPLALPDLYTLLDGEARFYLRRDVDDDGTTLYRLFHEGLAEWLRAPGSQPPDQDTPTAAVPPLNPADRLYERLLDSVPRDASGRRQWHLATPYLLRHTAQHAFSAGRLDELLNDGGYLQHADPHTLADALRHAHSEQARLNAAVYRASWSVHHRLPPAARRQLLALDAARFRHIPLQAELPGDADWQVRWATGSQVSTALVRTLTGHSDGVLAVGVVELDGRPHAVTGGIDGSVRVWDLTTGTQTRELTGHTSEVNAVEVVELDGHPHAITVGDDGSVRVWDLTTGTQTRELTGHTGEVRAVGVVELDGRPHAITGGGFAFDEGSVRVWDLTTGAQTRELVGHSGRVDAVRVVKLDGRPHAVTGSFDGSVRVWDLTTGTQTRELTGHTSGVRAAGVVELDGRPHAITGGGRFDGSVQVWDLTTGTQTRTLTGHTSEVNAVEVVELDGRPHAVTGSFDGSVRVWDLTTGTRTRELTGHTSEVRAVGVVELEGRPHAITGGGFGFEDGSVRVWDLTTGTQTRTLTGHAGGVRAVGVVELDGRPHAITGGGFGLEKGAVRVWDLTTATQTREFIGHAGVRAVGVVELDGRPHAITGGGFDEGSVRVWDLTTGTQTRTLTGHTGEVRAVGVVELEGRTHAITGGDDRTVRVWDLTTGTQTRTLTGHTGEVRAVGVVELEGRPHTVTGGDDRTVRVWDLTTGTQTRTLTGHTGEVRAVGVVELEGRTHAITGGDDRTVRVWDLTTGTCRTTFYCPARVSALTVTADATVIVGFAHEVAALSLAPLKGRLS